MPPPHNKVTLQISSDGGGNWATAALPFGDLHQHSYTILDTSEDSVFLHVNHIGEKSTWGNVYISNAGQWHPIIVYLWPTPQASHSGTL